MGLGRELKLDDDEFGTPNNIGENRTVMRRRAIGKVEHHLADKAPSPILGWIYPSMIGWLVARF